MMNQERILSKYENSIKDNISIVNHSMKGLSTAVFFDFVEISGINKNQLAEEIFEISLKTINRYKQDQKKFNPRNSELLLKLLALYKKGIFVFGQLSGFKQWLLKPAFGLGGKIPYELMITGTGIDLILEELIRIEYGDLA